MDQKSLSDKPDYQHLFETSPGLFLVLSPGFKIVAVSNQYLEATRTSRIDIIGKGIFEVFPDNPGDPEATGVSNLKASLNRVLQNKTADAMAPQKYDIPVPGSVNGEFEERYWSPLNTPVLGAAGNLLYIIHRVEDITEFIRLKKKDTELQTRTEQMESEIYLRAEQLQEANKQLRESEKLKNEFFANVSHELRTPLSLILAPLESVLSGGYGAVNDEQSHALKILHNNAVRLLQMVNTLLDFAKSEAGKMVVEREPIHFKSLLLSILNDFESMIGSKSLTLVQDLDIPDKQVLMDRYLFERILFNLLSNAIRFTPEGGTITVTAAIQNNMLELSVQDTGTGMEAKDLENIFEKFMQADGSTTRRFEGTGLGLAMVKEFAELLSGGVSVRSEPGKGSTFTVKLLTPVTDEKEKISATPKRANMLPRYKVSSETFKEIPNDNGQQKVLVCEDNEELALYIISLLSPYCQVQRVKDGTAGLALVKSWQPDLVLTDVMMPGRDGIELCTEVKSNVATSKITVVLLTALTHRDAMLRGWEAGADEYLFKPFHPDELVTRIRSLLAMLAERKKAANEIENYTRQLELANKEMESFSYSISHDLRAPLRAISGFCGILLQDYHPRLDDEGKRLINTVVSNTQKMNRQIDDLLKFVRTGKQSLHKTNFSMTALAGKVENELQQLLQHKAAITIAAMPDIMADEGLMAHVYHNLVSNAIKYSSGKPNPTIEIGYAETKKGGAFFVKDNGAGFDMNYYHKLFGVFQRLHGPDEFEGTGIGLAIVERIITKHGGTVWAEGKTGKGAAFYFTIP